MLKRMNYFVQTFEDLETERECQVRKMLYENHVIRERDCFDDEEMYNDYLESMEDLVFELCTLKGDELMARINMIKQTDKRVKVDSRKEGFDPIAGIKIFNFEKVPVVTLPNRIFKNDYRRNIFIFKCLEAIEDDNI